MQATKNRNIIFLSLIVSVQKVRDVSKSKEVLLLIQIGDGCMPTLDMITVSQALSGIITIAQILKLAQEIAQSMGFLLQIGAIHMELIK